MTFSDCREEGCDKKAIFFTDFCLEHATDPDGLTSEIHNFIAKNDNIKGYNFSYVPMEGVDFSDKDVSYSIFSHCKMTGAKFTDCRLISTFFDFSILDDADFSRSYIVFSIFGGASLFNVKFNESDINFCNFLGSNLAETGFLDTDLAYSRLIRCNTTDTRFYNCNFKKTIFEGVVFDQEALQTSNCQDAIMIECFGSKCEGKDYLV
jgi:uncharacterized protein YjbI with pentapeptide repeats